MVTSAVKSFRSTGVLTSIRASPVPPGSSAKTPRAGSREPAVPQVQREHGETLRRDLRLRRADGPLERLATEGRGAREQPSADCGAEYFHEGALVRTQGTPQ